MVYKVPDAHLDEYAQRLKEIFDITVTKGQLSTFLKSQGLTHKKALSSTLWANVSFKRKLENVIQS